MWSKWDESREETSADVANWLRLRIHRWFRQTVRRKKVLGFRFWFGGTMKKTKLKTVRVKDFITKDWASSSSFGAQIHISFIVNKQPNFFIFLPFIYFSFHSFPFNTAKLTLLSTCMNCFILTWEYTNFGHKFVQRNV